MRPVGMQVTGCMTVLDGPSRDCRGAERPSQPRRRQSAASARNFRAVVLAVAPGLFSRALDPYVAVMFSFLSLPRLSCLQFVLTGMCPRIPQCR